MEKYLYNDSARITDGNAAGNYVTSQAGATNKIVEKIKF